MGGRSFLSGNRSRLPPATYPGDASFRKHEASNPISPLLGLAPDGVFRAGPVTGNRGRLLPHLFTLTLAFRRWLVGKEAVCFLWHFPSGYPAWVLPSILLCGVRTFLEREHSLSRPSPPPRDYIIPEESGKAAEKGESFFRRDRLFPRKHACWSFRAHKPEIATSQPFADSGRLLLRNLAHRQARRPVPPVGQASLPGSYPVGQVSLPGSYPVGQVSLPGSYPVDQASLPGSYPVGQASLPGSYPVDQASLPGSYPVGQASLPGSYPVGQASLPGSYPVGQASLPGSYQ